MLLLLFYTVKIDGYMMDAYKRNLSVVTFLLKHKLANCVEVPNKNKTVLYKFILYNCYMLNKRFVIVGICRFCIVIL